MKNLQKKLINKLKDNLGLDGKYDEIYEVNQQILKNHDTSFLKKFFAVLSIFSYFNLLFEPLIKFFFGNEDDEDKLFDTMKFAIFNPGI